MEKEIWKRATRPAFWQGYFRWYEQWMAHSHYHDRIVKAITSVAESSWRILDIGAGNGVLSKPLVQMGCEVTALEPSSAMRNLLREKLEEDNSPDIHIERRPWEKVPCKSVQNYDLVLACNSLHLSQIGFASALEKVFAAKPKSVVVVTEFFSPEISIPIRCSNYYMEYARIELIGNAFAYHSKEEALEHWSANTGRHPDTWERDEIKQKLVNRDNHLWMDDSALVGLFCWKKMQ
jgi:ubiquinone/menaquinone biosynthesis C-methylase UbiE